MKWTIVTGRLRFHEGPLVLPDGSGIMVEIVAGHITRFHGSTLYAAETRTGCLPGYRVAGLGRLSKARRPRPGVGRAH